MGYKLQGKYTTAINYAEILEEGTRSNYRIM